VVRVCGKGSGRISIAGLVAYEPGRRAHLYYRVIVHRGRKGERRSFSETGYAALLSAAHHQLRAPLIVVWDNLNTHVSVKMRAFIDAHADWLTVIRLPAYAPDLNAAEGVWAHPRSPRAPVGDSDLSLSTSVSAACSGAARSPERGNCGWVAFQRGRRPAGARPSSCVSLSCCGIVSRVGRC
jgi:hypothetical protein